MMKSLLPKAAIFIVAIGLSACTEQKKEVAEPSTKERQVEVVEFDTVEDLMALFEKLNFTTEQWKAGNHEVPRLELQKVYTEWKERSDTLPVVEKKRVFFRLMAPLVLIANENILIERKVLLSEPMNSDAVKALAMKYRLIDESETVTEETVETLKRRIDIMPPSLALAQAAEESGWGTSRFAAEGNALFGQWDFSGNGMRPKRQRKELGDYGLARFDTPLASVEGYMLNINTTGAYNKLRTVRANLRSENKKITGVALVGTLDKYSERGQAYIDGLKEMMSFNHLYTVDDAFLADGKVYQLVKK